MIAKQAGYLLSLLWLAACTATGPLNTPGKTDSGEAAGSKESSEMRDHGKTSQASVTDDHVATIDASESSIRISVDETQNLTLARLLERLDRIATLDPGSVKQRIRQMDARSAELSPADRYELALLLTLNNTSSKALSRAITILDGLKASVKDRIAREIVLLHRRSFILEKQYRSERSKTIELTKKIERLKGLEQDLDKSNTRMQESLTPSPGDRQQP